MRGLGKIHSCCYGWRRGSERCSVTQRSLFRHRRTGERYETKQEDKVGLKQRNCKPDNCISVFCSFSNKKDRKKENEVKVLNNRTQKLRI